jgi:hypothetical protein
MSEIMSNCRGVEYVPEYSSPPSFTTVTTSKAAMEFVKDTITSIGTSLKIRYDPKQDRVVFIIERDGVAIDAVGKLLSGYGPKWFRYGSSGRSFLLEGSRTCVVVEDVLSACVVNQAGYSAMALLGTHLKELDLRELICYDTILVALDPDAYSKGIAMATRLSAYADARSVRIPNDLKYFTPNEIEEILNE